MKTARDILAELVACKEMKERMVTLSPIGIRGDHRSIDEALERERLLIAYRKRQPLAWEAAKKLLTTSDGWQPIETAPKDGTRVLTFRVKFREAMAVAWFDGEEWRPVHGSAWPDPTHWMPLPEPPKEGP